MINNWFIFQNKFWHQFKELFQPIPIQKSLMEVFKIS